MSSNVYKKKILPFRNNGQVYYGCSLSLISMILSQVLKHITGSVQELMYNYVFQTIAFIHLADSTPQTIRALQNDQILAWENGCPYLRWHPVDHPQVLQFLMMGICTVQEEMTERCVQQPEKDTILGEMCGNRLHQCIQEGNVLLQYWEGESKYIE